LEPRPRQMRALPRPRHTPNPPPSLSLPPPPPPSNPAGKQLLDDLKKEGEELMRTNPKSDRLQPYKAQYMRLCKLYVDAMKDHQKSKEGMRKVQTEDLVRRGMIIYGEGKTEGEIREKVEKDPANFVRDALMEEAADEAQQAYVEAQSRARDVEMLVRSLNEVAAMFQDLAVLVQHQSEMLDSIEENVESATTYIKKGNQAVRKK
jgi:t-SNARE complex subunit (syntaxin)